MRCIASEQAFLDSLLTEQQLTFHTARVARLRADRIKSVNDREPPYGVESADGRLMKLSPNHLGPDTAQWFCDALRRFAPDLLYTNPSHVETLAAFVRENDLTLPIPLVVTTSETLDSNGRALIEEAFGATVIDYYGQAERVVFAAASPDDGYYFNPAYGRVELFPDDHVAAPPGYRAFDIVGTGFWNDATPLVRFRTDDYALVPADYGDAELEDVAPPLRPLRAIRHAAAGAVRLCAKPGQRHRCADGRHRVQADRSAHLQGRLAAKTNRGEDGRRRLEPRPRVHFLTMSRAS